jgi:predicted transcriptional regulator
MSGIIDQNNPAMLVKKSDGTFGIITRHDIIKSLGNK